jgi:DNA-binding transcriptional LysR family regulator
MFAVVVGTGASVLPDYMCSPNIRSGKLVVLQPGWGLPPVICPAKFPACRAMVLAVRKLIDFLAENLDGAEIHAHPCSLDFLRAGQVR